MCVSTCQDKALAALRCNRLKIKQSVCVIDHVSFCRAPFTFRHLASFFDRAAMASSQFAGMLHRRRTPFARAQPQGPQVVTPHLSSHSNDDESPLLLRAFVVVAWACSLSVYVRLESIVLYKLPLYMRLRRLAVATWLFVCVRGARLFPACLHVGLPISPPQVRCTGFRRAEVGACFPCRCVVHRCGCAGFRLAAESGACRALRMLARFAGSHQHDGPVCVADRVCGGPLPYCHRSLASIARGAKH